jgi:RNA polymerase sigma factor for flagellar operon FliA
MQKGRRLQRKGDILMLAQRIAELPRLQKTVLALYYYENLPAAEIAACLGLAEHEIELIRAEAVRLLQTSYFCDLKQPDTLN